MININEVPRFVTEAGASHLLEIPEAEVNRISEESGLGRVECAGEEKKTYFTYEELLQVWLLSAYQKMTKH